MKKRLLKQIQYAILLLIAGGIYAGWVKKTGLAIPCPFHYVTGFRCPGCGVTRMCMALLQGDFRNAMSYNIGLTIAAPFGIFIFLKRVRRYIRTGNGSFTKVENVMLWTIVAVLLVFGVVRNFIGI